jgi:Rrf2 family protein
MRLSRNAHYAIRTVIDLALRERGRSGEVARRQGIPQAYMARIVHGLSTAGIVRTFRGTHGGIQLAKPPASITLRDVVQATEGPLALNLCVVWDDCRCAQPCPVRTTLARLQSVVERELDSVTVEQLAVRLPGGWPGADGSAVAVRAPR